jgi:hypothetical protein
MTEEVFKIQDHVIVATKKDKEEIAMDEVLEALDLVFYELTEKLGETTRFLA